MKISDLIPWQRGKREAAPARRGTTDPVQALQSDINRAFEEFWRGFELPLSNLRNLGFANDALPPVDIRETDKEVEVIAELPGMDEKDIDVRVAQGTLTIRGEKKSEREEKKKNYVIHERNLGVMERVVPLPDGIDLDSAKAKFKNGVLTISFAKTPEAQSAVKRIAVRAS